MTRRPLNLENEIKDLYSAERQLTKAFPKMAKGSNDVSLQAAFKDHLKETEAQVARLEEVAKLLDILDLGIIGARSRVEHYEMAGYMTAISLAQRLKKA